MTSLLRARLTSAELRAFTAERSLQRSRAAHRKTRLLLGDVLEDLEAARHGGARLARVLRRLAARHLGEGASRLDVDALVGRWLAEDGKRAPMKRTVTLLVNIDAIIERMLRGEDGHG